MNIFSTTFSVLLYCFSWWIWTSNCLRWDKHDSAHKSKSKRHAPINNKASSLWFLIQVSLLLILDKFSIHTVLCFSKLTLKKFVYDEIKFKWITFVITVSLFWLFWYNRTKSQNVFSSDWSLSFKPSSSSKGCSATTWKLFASYSTG